LLIVAGTVAAEGNVTLTVCTFTVMAAPKVPVMVNCAAAPAVAGVAVTAVTVNPLTGAATTAHKLTTSAKAANKEISFCFRLI